MNQSNCSFEAHYNHEHIVIYIYNYYSSSEIDV